MNELIEVCFAAHFAIKSLYKNTWNLNFTNVHTHKS